ncbi:MAG: CBS domain-containing protein [Planctomycetes bacterium]|nr:CBS domain-containing protein [Planctomycetota bacterium]
MKELCEEVMSRNVETCRESDPVVRAARIMRERNIGFLPVLDASSRLLGAITDRDLTLRVLAENKNPDTPVRDVLVREQLLTVRVPQAKETKSHSIKVN